MLGEANIRTEKADTSPIPIIQREVEQQIKRPQNKKTKRNRIPRPIRDRLRLFISYLGLSSSEFAKSLGVAESAVSKIDDNPTKTLARIYRLYPSLNQSWVESGVGEMLITDGRLQANRISGGSMGAIEWRLRSIGYQWAIEEVMKGTHRKLIVAEFNKRHRHNPEDFSTRTGQMLTDAILSGWIKKAGITPPIPDKQYPYKQQENKEQTKSSPESEKPVDGPKSISDTSLVVNGDMPVRLTHAKRHSRELIKTHVVKKIDWPAILKWVALTTGTAISVIIVVVIISEIVLPAIIAVLFFLSFLFAKK